MLAPGARPRRIAGAKTVRTAVPQRAIDYLGERDVPFSVVRVEVRYCAYFVICAADMLSCKDECDGWFGWPSGLR